MVFLPSLLAIGLAPLLAAAQLSGSVGPKTSYATKAAHKTCNVLNYGAVADQKTDIGPAITSAWNACKSGGVVYIPSGNYALGSFVTLSGGQSTAIRLDGIIYRTGTGGGNMIFIEHTSDFELFSATSKGAVQGLGYQFHQKGSLSGPRILRMYEVTDFSVHDLALVDSPSFHFSMDTCQNGEVYNMAIRGGNSGGLDGIDVWSTNIWVHDVRGVNKLRLTSYLANTFFRSRSPTRTSVLPSRYDIVLTNSALHCASETSNSLQSPAKNILVENIYCNWSGGCAMGSLGSGVDISDVLYRNVYTWSSNQMYMIKSNGGSGTVSNLVLENFIGLFQPSSPTPRPNLSILTNTRPRQRLLPRHRPAMEQHVHRRRQRRTTPQHHHQELERHRVERRPARTHQGELRGRRSLHWRHDRGLCHVDRVRNLPEGDLQQRLRLGCLPEGRLRWLVQHHGHCEGCTGWVLSADYGGGLEDCVWHCLVYSDSYHSYLVLSRCDSD